MESPPSTSTWSEHCILSDDSGLLLTNNSVSSGSMSGESRSYGKSAMGMQDSDCEDNSLDGMSDIMCGENFNTLKKVPHWMDLSDCKRCISIEPPLEFQDKPNILLYKDLADKLVPKIVKEGIMFYCTTFANSIVQYPSQDMMLSYWTSEFLPFGNPPNSTHSLVQSRLSSSHNSLSVPAACKVDDSTFITQAVSHDTLVGGQISDIYNVPFDSDMYAVPADVVRQPSRPKRIQQHKKKRRNTSSCNDFDDCIKQSRQSSVKKYYINYVNCNRTKRHSVAGSSGNGPAEPLHMTLQEVHSYLQTLYSSSSDSSVHTSKVVKKRESAIVTDNNVVNSNALPSQKIKKNTFLINVRNKHVKDTDNISKEQSSAVKCNKTKKSVRISSLKQTLCNIFRFRRFISPEKKKNNEEALMDKENYKPITNRALPPVPAKKQDVEEQGVDFTTSIQKVKDYGWYWGPISSEAAEKILSNEPDGSFIVRDSSDDHYIFSLTFKLNNSVRHVRIEHDQGNFSFGSCTKFKSQTIVEFIENAVEHSRSGRYLFFLHRRPVIGPVRVQLLHPVSRFKQIQSLQHMCRFVILKMVRRDLLPKLPLPRRMIDYLNTPHYYSEHLSDVEEQEECNTNNNNNNNVITNVLVPNSEVSSPSLTNSNRQS